MKITVQLCIKDLIIDTENCVRHLDTKILTALASGVPRNFFRGGFNKFS